MMSWDRETGQCTNADIWREGAKKAQQAMRLRHSADNS